MKGAFVTAYLSEREVEVLRRVALGCMSKNIAAELGIGYKTVEKHRSSLCRKLHARSAAELTRHAIELGVIPVVVRPLFVVARETGTRYYLPDFVAVQPESAPAPGSAAPLGIARA